MRKLIFQMALSLDGFYEGPKGELDWHLVDKEFYADVYELFETLDGEIMGRKTYETMATYWPTETALREDPVTAKWMNSMRKYVVSRTLKTVILGEFQPPPGGCGGSHHPVESAARKGSRHRRLRTCSLPAQSKAY